MCKNNELIKKIPTPISGAMMILVGEEKNEIISLPEAKPAPITDETISIEIEKIFFT